MGPDLVQFSYLNLVTSVIDIFPKSVVRLANSRKSAPLPLRGCGCARQKHAAVEKLSIGEHRYHQFVPLYESDNLQHQNGQESRV
jgi:hypothetical protein